MAWDDALARADEACARHFDTVSCVALAMTKAGPNAVLAPDETRPEFGFMASIEMAPELSSFADANRPRPADRNIRQVSRVCLTALASSWPWQLRQGDRVRTPDALYQVAASPDRDGTARIVLWLNRVST